MRLLIMGGTFNPPHIGHLFLAEEIVDAFGYEVVLFVPSHVPAHKDMDLRIDPRHRLNMLEQAVQGRSQFRVDDCEIRRGGISYSIETVADVKERYRLHEKPGFVIGDDLLAGFSSWKRAEALSCEVDLIVAHRSNSEEIRFEYPHRYIDNLILPISSTDIRRRVREGKPYRYLVPEGVYEYIRTHKVYVTES